MRNFKYIWVIGLAITLVIVTVPIVLAVSPEPAPRDNPRAALPVRPSHVDHTPLIEGPFETGQEVTAACLTCHPDAAAQVMDTPHFQWQGEPVLIGDRTEPIAIGKKNLFNNFCLGIQSNWEGCTRCHAGYGWDSADYDFENPLNVDCLACHDQSGGYVKSTAGLPAEGVDLLAAAQSVGTPTRQNCGTCHFYGGGGNAVKHGDLDETMFYPTEHTDVHMGGQDFECVDCHWTEDHRILGRSMSVSVESSGDVYCTNCHSIELHEDDRINEHVDTVACQTCHVPQGAVRDATKMEWDWSTAGQDLPEDDHVYLRIKGSFVYEAGFTPEYYWYNGTNQRYLMGDTIDPQQVTVFNQPNGGIDDPAALIWPFKVHRGMQPYDTNYLYLLQPKTVGEGGYWIEFDWDQAFRLGAEATGIPYSGGYDFAPTEMYWNLSHMVQPVEHTLQCTDCHGEAGRLDWQALGYYGDPMVWGGRGD